MAAIFPVCGEFLPRRQDDIHAATKNVAMRAEAKHPLTVRFGPFEADLRSRKLLKSGRRIKLQGQPFQVLTALLERAGQTVTREELREAIWHSDTFVDFERGLNKAINRLRERWETQLRIRSLSRRSPGADTDSSLRSNGTCGLWPSFLSRTSQEIPTWNTGRTA
jgi:Transcriptional regulatory protein, C terminal